MEVKKGKGKSVQPIPSSSYQWETAATNLDEFQDVSVSSKVLMFFGMFYVCVTCPRPPKKKKLLVMLSCLYTVKYLRF